MNNEIRLIVDTVSNEKSVPKEIVFEAIEAALESATRKRYGMDWDVRVVIDRATGEYDTFRRWTVVSLDRTDPETGEKIPFNREAELTMAQAEEKKSGGDETLEVEVTLGEQLEDPIESIEFGRIAAQTAKQVIMQRLRQAKREQTADEYRNRIGELVTGTVKKSSREVVIVELTNSAEALLRRSEMLPREALRIGERVRGYLQEVKPEPRGPQLVVSRACPEMIIELFRIEVPEIAEGAIEIKGAARDPGLRAKIAVQAKDNRIDPVGACVGMRGARVQAVSNELGGERVDIVLWDDNPAQFVINAIAPAEVASIVVDDETNTMDVIVNQDQLSAAIGRNGQNVRLASQLTGWRLNVISETQAEEREQEENERLLAMFQAELTLDENTAIAIIEEGFTTLEEVAFVPIQEMLAAGIEESVVRDIRGKAKSIIEARAEAVSQAVEKGGDLMIVEGMTESLAQSLINQGVLCRDDLAEQSIDDLLQVEGMDQDRAGKLIMAARAHWFEEN